MYDQNTVISVMNGDEKAFEKMYADCFPAVYRQAFSNLHQAEFAKEATRLTFADIQQHCAKLRKPSDFDEWVYRLVNYHSDMIKNKSYDSSDLGLIWDGPSAKTEANTEEKNSADVDMLKQDVENEEDKASSNVWKPIIFPPEGAETETASDDAILPWHINLSSKTNETHSESAPLELLPHGGIDMTKGQERNITGEVAKPSQQTGVYPRRPRRVRYEVATAHRAPHFSYERVPYDYIPYEDTSQFAYDTIEFEESPKAVYEHIPYERTSEQADPEVKTQEIPYNRVDNTKEKESLDAAKVDLAKKTLQDVTTTVQSIEPVQASTDMGLVTSTIESSVKVQESNDTAVGQNQSVQEKATQTQSSITEVGINHEGPDPLEEKTSLEAVPENKDEQKDGLTAKTEASQEEGQPEAVENTTTKMEGDRIEVVDQKDLVPENTSKRISAGAGFFIGAIVLLGIAIAIGFWKGFF